MDKINIKIFIVFCLFNISHLLQADSSGENVVDYTDIESSYLLDLKINNDKEYKKQLSQSGYLNVKKLRSLKLKSFDGKMLDDEYFKEVNIIERRKPKKKMGAFLLGGLAGVAINELYLPIKGFHLFPGKHSITVDFYHILSQYMSGNTLHTSYLYQPNIKIDFLTEKKTNYVFDVEVKNIINNKYSFMINIIEKSSGKIISKINSQKEINPTEKSYSKEERKQLKKNEDNNLSDIYLNKSQR